MALPFWLPPPLQLIKYGVVRLEALQADLLHWTSLYCAGRLHKPVATLAQHPGLAAAQQHNLLSALRVALLLLPPRFGTLVRGPARGCCCRVCLYPPACLVQCQTCAWLEAGCSHPMNANELQSCTLPCLQDLLHAVCAISYSGDVRMGLAEDSRKVHRIVAGSEAGLCQLYAAPLAAAQRDWRVLDPTAAGASSSSSGSDGSWVRDDSPAATAELAAGLPAHVLQRLAAPLGLPQPGQHEGEKLKAVGRALAAAERHRQQQLLRHAIHAIVGASSKRQALSGLLTAGVVKSVRYGFAKLRKAWR
jgi:translocator assembly and maintenance protein 41